MQSFTSGKYKSSSFANTKGRAIFFQPKLSINQPNDVYEQEADATADKVMRMQEPSAEKKFFSPTGIQRKCAGCEEEEKEQQAKNNKALSGGEISHVVQQSGSAPGTIQRQVPAGNAGPQPACQTPASTVEEISTDDLLAIDKITPPCYACPNSQANACAKLAQKIFPPVATGPVQFSWQVRFLTMYREKGVAINGPGKKTHVVQRVEKIFNFSVPPAAGYAYTSPFWEAFGIDQNGQTDIDYWQFEIPDLTAGTWEMKGDLYLTDQLPAGMAVGNVPDSGGAPSTANEPKGLGRVRGTRRITGRFDFTGVNKRHSYQ